jgi:hypothetical protein
MHYLGVCCIAKDEHPYLKEWVDHHLLIGAEKIIIFDNESNPPLKDGLREYIDHGLVAVHMIQGKEQQIPAYRHCLNVHGDSFAWIAFLDVDECIIPKSHGDARLILCDYEDFGGLGVHWVEFGSSGHLGRPSNSQLSSYVHRFPLEYRKNMHIKSIVQPSKTLEPFNPHKFIFRDPWYCVDENFFPIAESEGPFTASRIQLNHYYFRSQQDFCQKLERGRADRADEAGKRKHEAFRHQLQQATVLDETGSRHGQNLERVFDSFEAIRTFMRNRAEERDEFNMHYCNILRYIACGKTNHALHLAKHLVINGAKKDITDYIIAKIHKKNNDIDAAICALRKILSRHPDYDICLEYASLLIETGKRQEARDTLRYVQWKFADTIKQDPSHQRGIDALMDKTHEPCVSG